MRPEPITPILSGSAASTRLAGIVAAAATARRNRRRFMLSRLSQGMVPGRRRALAMLAAAAASLRAGRLLSQESRIMTKKIPASGEALPVIGVGTWQTFDVGDDAAARAPLGELLKLLDGNVVDSSPMYGSSESVAGDLIASLGMRKQLF